LLGVSTFEKRYGAVMRSAKRREETLAEKAAEERRLIDKRAEEARAREEARERQRREERIVENDDKLRGYQQEAVKDILSSWHEKRNLMLQMPTGTGKTRLFVALINALNTTEAENYGISGKPRFLIVTHREELVEQISEALSSHYQLAHTIVSPQSSTIEKKSLNTNNIYVSSIQYLARHIGKDFDGHFDFIIIDEAHHSLADSYRLLWQAYPTAYKLGVIATPFRLKGDGFTQLYDTLIKSQGISEFIGQGYLADYRFYTVSDKQAALQKVNRLTRFSIGGDYQTKDLQEIYANSEETAFLYECYKQYTDGKRGIIYAVNQLHAGMIAGYFAERGISIANIDSKTASTKRKELITQFRSGELQILVNVELFGEGFDCPAIEFAMLARPTKSLAMYLQQVGRALRPFVSEELRVKNEESLEQCSYVGKNSDDLNKSARNTEKVTILDCVGLYNRFGLPEKEWDWEYFFARKKRARGEFTKPLGIGKETDRMVEIDTPRVTAMKKEIVDKKRATVDIFRSDNGLYGIRNVLGEIITNPTCVRLTKTDYGWFHGKDKDGTTVIYDKTGHLVFKRERSSVELKEKGHFMIHITSIDGTRFEIGPYNEKMGIAARYLGSCNMIYLGAVYSHSMDIFYLYDNAIAMTSYKLSLETRFFRKATSTRIGNILLDLDLRPFTINSLGKLQPKALKKEYIDLVLEARSVWEKYKPGLIGAYNGLFEK